MKRKVVSALLVAMSVSMTAPPVFAAEETGRESAFTEALADLEFSDEVFGEDLAKALADFMQEEHSFESLYDAEIGTADYAEKFLTDGGFGQDYIDAARYQTALVFEEAFGDQALEAGKEIRQEILDELLIETDLEDFENVEDMETAYTEAGGPVEDYSDFEEDADASEVTGTDEGETASGETLEETDAAAEGTGAEAQENETPEASDGDLSLIYSLEFSEDVFGKSISRKTAKYIQKHGDGYSSVNEAEEDIVNYALQIAYDGGLEADVIKAVKHQALRVFEETFGESVLPSGIFFRQEIMNDMGINVDLSIYTTLADLEFAYTEAGGITGIPTELMNQDGSAGEYGEETESSDEIGETGGETEGEAQGEAESEAQGEAQGEAEGEAQTETVPESEPETETEPEKSLADYCGGFVNIVVQTGQQIPTPVISYDSDYVQSVVLDVSGVDVNTPGDYGFNYVITGVNGDVQNVGAIVTVTENSQLAELREDMVSRVDEIEAGKSITAQSYADRWLQAAGEAKERIRNCETVEEMQSVIDEAAAEANSILSEQQLSVAKEGYVKILNDFYAECAFANDAQKKEADIILSDASAKIQNAQTIDEAAAALEEGRNSLQSVADDDSVDDLIEMTEADIDDLRTQISGSSTITDKIFEIMKTRLRACADSDSIDSVFAVSSAVTEDLHNIIDEKNYSYVSTLFTDLKGLAQDSGAMAVIDLVLAKDIPDDLAHIESYAEDICQALAQETDQFAAYLTGKCGQPVSGATKDEAYKMYLEAAGGAGGDLIEEQLNALREEMAAKVDQIEAAKSLTDQTAWTAVAEEAKARIRNASSREEMQAVLDEVTKTAESMLAEQALAQIRENYIEILKGYYNEFVFDTDGQQEEAERILNEAVAKIQSAQSEEEAAAAMEEGRTALQNIASNGSLEDLIAAAEADLDELRTTIVGTSTAVDRAFEIMYARLEACADEGSVDDVMLTANLVAEDISQIVDYEDFDFISDLFTDLKGFAEDSGAAAVLDMIVARNIPQTLASVESAMETAYQAVMQDTETFISYLSGRCGEEITASSKDEAYQKYLEIAGGGDDAEELAELKKNLTLELDVLKEKANPNYLNNDIINFLESAKNSIMTAETADSCNSLFADAKAEFQKLYLASMASWYGNKMDELLASFNFTSPDYLEEAQRLVAQQKDNLNKAGSEEVMKQCYDLVETSLQNLSQTEAGSEELSAARTEAIAAITSMVTDPPARIQKIINKYINRINSAKSVEKINELVEKCKTALQNEQADINSEEAAVKLANAKTDAINKLRAYSSTTPNIAESNALNSYINQINNASTPEEVEELLVKGKAAIDTARTAGVTVTPGGSSSGNESGSGGSGSGSSEGNSSGSTTPAPTQAPEDTRDIATVKNDAVKTLASMLSSIYTNAEASDETKKYAADVYNKYVNAINSASSSTDVDALLASGKKELISYGAVDPSPASSDTEENAVEKKGTENVKTGDEHAGILFGSLAAFAVSVLAVLGILKKKF